jgi:hypothetical protein
MQSLRSDDLVHVCFRLTRRVDAEDAGYTLLMLALHKSLHAFMARPLSSRILSGYEAPWIYVTASQRLSHVSKQSMTETDLDHIRI